jgi:hypothetical protein
VHNANEKLTWYGPGAWRQTGVNWSYEYQLRRMGVLVAPVIKVAAPSREGTKSASEQTLPAQQTIS